jgi:hypothetical protein
MAEEIATLPKPIEPPKTGRIGFKEALGVQEPFLQRKAELQPQMAAAEGDIAKAKQAQSEVLAGGKQQAMQEFATAERGAKEAYEAKLEAEPLPAFIPTKDTAQDIAGLFSVISVLGMLVGGGGKMAGQRAMGAMNGMLEGYRKGRSDLYKQQRNEFDANFKSMLQKHQEFRKEMEDAVKLAATNKEAGMAAAELAATKAGSTVVQAQLRKGDLAGAYKLVDESEKGAQEALKLEAKARDAEATEKFRKEQAAANAQIKKELAELKAQGSSKATQQAFIAQRAVTALQGAASTMESVMKLPAGSTAGFLPNLSTKDGMFNFVRNAAGRKVSSNEAKSIETLYSGLSRYLATIEASGTAVGLVGLTQQLEKLQPKAGDTVGDVALKLADIRRISTEAVSAMVNSGLLPKQAGDAAQVQVERMEKAIPFTTNDVVEAMYGGKKTLGEASQGVIDKKKRLEELERKARGEE